MSSRAIGAGLDAARIGSARGRLAGRQTFPRSPEPDTKRDGRRQRRRRWAKPDVQCFRIARPRDVARTAKPFDRRDLARRRRGAGGQGLDCDFTSCRPRQRDREHRIAFAGEANVVLGERLALRVGERSFDDGGGAFTERRPRPRGVNGFAIQCQPPADLAQQALFRFGNRPIRSGADVEQQRAILADDVDEVVDQRVGGLVLLVQDVAPGVLRHGRVRLPEHPPCPGTIRRRASCS